MNVETTTSTDNPLASLAEKINAGHRMCLKALRASLEYARETGTLLHAVKTRLEAVGGSWRKWAQKHCDCSLSEAGRYMRIADHYNDLLRSGENLSKLSVSKALRLLSPGRGRKQATSEAIVPFRVASKDEVTKLVRKAGGVEFAADSAQKKFIAEKVATVARQILALANEGQAKGVAEASAAEVAIALLEQLKEALYVGLVIEVDTNPHASRITKVLSNGMKPQIV